jgi:protein SCO1/2
MPSTFRRLPAALVAAGLVVLGFGASFAQDRMEPLPADLEGVDVIDRPGANLPLWLTFFDDSGEVVTLGKYFKDRPVIVTMNYSNCPMLCSLQLNGLVDGLRGLRWTAGEEFEMVTVSIDPSETATRAAQTKQKYLGDYGRPEAAQGWHFLTGAKAHVKELADSLGFGFRYVEERGEYAHAAVTFVATPDGKLSRALYGVLYDPRTLRLSLVEASDGKIGSTVDKILLYCFHYDATKGRYGPVAVRIMQLGGGLSVLLLGVTLLGFWRRDHHRKPHASPNGSA